MKRLWRIVGGGITIFLALACGVAVVGWVRGRSVLDEWTYRGGYTRGEPTRIELVRWYWSMSVWTSPRGVCLSWFTKDGHGVSGWIMGKAPGWEHLSLPMASAAAWVRSMTPQEPYQFRPFPNRRSLAGIAVMWNGRLVDGDEVRSRAVVVPWGWLVAGLGAGPTWWAGRGLVRRRVRRTRRARGKCVACGYDCRASCGRCPECGAGLPEL